MSLSPLSDRPQPTKAETERAPSIEALFGSGLVRARCAQADALFVAELADAERSGTESMASGRSAEFATGRYCAREALVELGGAGPVTRCGDGAPRWPDGFIGSITHTAGYCSAVAAPAGTLASIGIDIEEIDRLTERIERRVLTAAEQSIAADLAGQTRRTYVATVFAAKEAFYKAQYPLTTSYLGFDVVSVVIGSGGDNLVTFEPESGAADPELVAAAHGSRLIDAGRVAVGVQISAIRSTEALPSHS